MSMQKNFTRTAIVVALSAIFPVAGAYADDEVEALINPNVTDVSANLPYINKINPLYRQYNGINHEGLNGNANIDIVNRDADGTWFKLYGENLGLSTQEAGVSYEKQGDWAIGLDYNQIPRYSPYEIRTSVTGIGSNTINQPNVSNSGGPTTAAVGTFPTGTATGQVTDTSRLSEVTLKTQRDITTLTASKYLLEALKISVSFKNENKTGTRMDGVRGNASSVTNNSVSNKYGSFLFAPEPIDQNHQQIEAIADYVTKEYQISAGYYGSFLTNNDPSLTVNGGANTLPLQGGGYYKSAISPLALAPDNSFNQFYVNGAYNFTEATRGTLKVSYSEGKQNDQFIARGNAMALNVTSVSRSDGRITYNTTGNPGTYTLVPDTEPGIGSSLNAKVQTTEVFGSLSSRITSQLKLAGSWRYQDRKDKTQELLYESGLVANPAYIANASARPTTIPGTFFYYKPDSYIANWGKVDADYNFGQGYSANLGADYKSKKDQEWLQNEIAYGREKVEETTYRFSVRKAMSETLNGTLLFARSLRSGSEWNTPEDQIYPTYMSDRNRNRYRAMIDWLATDDLNMQFAYEAFFDDYTRAAYGLENGNGQTFSFDASYRLSDDWNANTWYSVQTGKAKQHSNGSVCTTLSNGTCTNTTVNWDATLNQNSDQFGLGVTGKINVIKVGAQYVYYNDKTEQEFAIPVTPAPGAGVIPNTSYKHSLFKAYGLYPVSKDTKIRLDYIYDQRKMDDYTWNTWIYADGTRVYQDPNQITQIIGLSLIQSF